MAIEAGDSRMTIAKIAYLSTPAPNRYILNFQLFGSDEIVSIEVSRAHLTNILIDGTSVALRETSSNRVSSPTGAEHERA